MQKLTLGGGNEEGNKNAEKRNLSNAIIINISSHSLSWLNRL